MAIRIGMDKKNSVESLILNSMRTTGDHFKRPNLYGASAGGCQRENFLSAQENPLDGQSSITTAQSYFYMEIGNGIEDAIIGGLDRAEKLFGDNVYLPESFPLVRGKIDIIFLDDSGEICLGEIKSCGKLPSEPKSGHLAQATTYASISGNDNVYIIYVSRNVLQTDGSVAIKAFKIDTSLETLKKNMQIITESGLAIKNGYIPGIPSHMSKSKCYYCPYFEKYCWGENASDGSYIRTPDDKSDESVIELNSTLQKMIEERPLRFLKHLESLKTQDRVVKSGRLLSLLDEKINQLGGSKYA